MLRDTAADTARFATKCTLYLFNYIVIYSTICGNGNKLCQSKCWKNEVSSTDFRKRKGNRGVIELETIAVLIRFRKIGSCCNGIG